MATKTKFDKKLSLRDKFQRYPINGNTFKQLIQAGMTWLKTHQQVVNSLNVFPVPDGDTGTNMVLTMQSAMEEVNGMQEKHLGKMVKAISQGALMGARGNSGVILSQLWRGFARALEDRETLDGAGLVDALVMARETAYKGVVRPVEGTILTVSKDMAIAAEQALNESDDFVVILETALDAAEISVDLTPTLLPILAEAGVVDSGGKGLFYIFEGMVRYINEEDLETPQTEVVSLNRMALDNSMEAVEEGQDYEVVVDFRPHQPLDIQRFYADLEEIGTSIQVGEGEGMYRMHIHVPTENRDKPLNYIETIGTWTNVAMENLMDQMDQTMKDVNFDDIELTEVKQGQIAVVTVAPGAGLARIFASLGVAAIIEGGQTMNPSTQQIVEAFENLPTEKVLILPNNKNIILAAQAAAEVSVKQVMVVPCKTVPQGISALMRLVPDGELQHVYDDMCQALTEVETGEVTTATRDVEIDGVEVKEGEIIGLHNGKLVVSAPDLKEACLTLLDTIGMDDYELVTMFYGKGLDSGVIEEIETSLTAAFPNVEIEEPQMGGQPNYQFIFSIE